MSTCAIGTDGEDECTGLKSFYYGVWRFCQLKIEKEKDSIGWAGHRLYVETKREEGEYNKAYEYKL